MPCTSESVEYGTPDMAYAIMNLTKEMKSDFPLLVMGGHPEGILAFGASLSETTEQLINIYNLYKND